MRGGKREGAGRPKSGTNYVKVRMTKEQQATFQNIGGSQWLQEFLKEIQMKANEIMEEALSSGEQTVWSAIQALEDGQYLTDIGCTDADQQAVEEAYAQLQKMLDEEIASGKFDPKAKEYVEEEE